MNIVVELQKRARRWRAVLYALRYPKQFRHVLQKGVAHLYQYGELAKYRIRTIALEEVVQEDLRVELLNPWTQEGNVSYRELLALCSIVRAGKFKKLLEIGTFDGNTALQWALNSLEEAQVHTIDLPHEDPNTQGAILQDDLKYIFHQTKLKRKYLGTKWEHKIVQHFGDSNTYDFSKIGALDFCFIDGGHSYECVKRDTENVLKILSKDGMLVWHDYNPNCHGVYRFLNELSNRIQLQHLEGTSLVIFNKAI